MEKRYRKNVAAVIVNSEGQLLACQRADEFGTWQLPQGGIDDDETAEVAVLRELQEEIGTRAVRLLGCLDTPIRYEWPREFIPGFCGQEQVYFLVELLADAVIDLESCQPPEFRDFRWMAVDEFLELTSDFKKAAYKQALQELQLKFGLW